MGLLDDLASLAGEVVGTVAGIAIAPLAITLGVSERLIREAIKSGCTTVEEIKAFVEGRD